MQQEDSPRKAIFQWLARASDDVAQQDLPQLTSPHDLQDTADELGKLGEPNVAAELKLHSPFRKLEEHARGRHSKKEERYQRKRSLSTERTLDRLKRGERISKRNQTARQTLESSTSASDQSNDRIADENRQEAIEHHAATTQPYERRRRRKTKEDRYVLKENPRDRRRADNRGKKTEEKGRKRHKRREKTGAAILHGFTAANVAPERLTLQHPSKVGLFTKGRASSPYRRRALPDLSFSELKFHNSHHHQREEPSKRHDRTKDSSRLQKSLEQNEEFSKFFASRQSPLNAISNNKVNLKLRDQEILRTSEEPHKKPKLDLSSTPQPSLPPIDFPGRPFLGFGKCAPRSGSPIRRSDDVHMDSTPIKRKIRAIESATNSQIMWSQSPITPRTRAARLDMTKKKELAGTQRKPRKRMSSENPESLQKVKHTRDLREIVQKHPLTLASVDEKSAHATKTTGGETSSKRPISNSELKGKVDRIPPLETIASENTHAKFENKRTSNDHQGLGVSLIQGQQNGFLTELGQLLQKWNRREAPVSAIHDTRIANSDIPPLELKEANHAEIAPGETEHHVTEETAQAQVTEPTEGVIEASMEKSLPCGRDQLDVNEVHTRCDPLPNAINDSSAKFQKDGQDREGFSVQTQQFKSNPNQLPLMPFPNTHGRHSGPSLLMSPESIYEKQIYEQEGYPSASRVADACPPYWPSPILGQRSQSRSTFRTTTRSYLRPPSRPFSRRYGISSTYSPVLAPAQHWSPQYHYRTPSLSNFSAAERTNAYAESTPEEKSRFFAISEPQHSDVISCAENYQHDHYPEAHLPQNARLDNIDWQGTEHFELSVENLAEPPENAEPAFRPTTGSLGDPYHQYIEDMRGEETFSEASRDQGHLPDANVICTGAASLNELEDFPARFWTPNKLY